MSFCPELSWQGAMPILPIYFPALPDERMGNNGEICVFDRSAAKRADCQIVSYAPLLVPNDNVNVVLQISPATG